MLKWNDIIDTIREKKISGKVITMAAALLVLTGLVGIRQSIPTSSTVGDRELPIYCVETQEPKIALTFDAAWGNEDTQKIMEILKKHNVKVTFFMTGGWVEHYPDDVKMILVRPPYGDYDNAVVKTAKKCGYYTIQWDVDSLDWKDYGVDSIIKTVTEHKHLGNGSIILCHNGAKYTAQALDTLITTLQDKGYTFVPLSQLIYRDNYHMNHEGRQISDN